MGLKYSPIVQLKIYRHLHSGKTDLQYGQSCLYVKLDNTSGAKLYWSAKTRNLAYNNQNKLCEIGLSPKIGEKFDIPFLSVNWSEYHDVGINDGPFKVRNLVWKSFYGYLTQHASKVNEKKDYPKIKSFLDKISKLGYDEYDLENSRNIGKIGNKIVCIDTDPQTLVKK